jgi:hypothetical protein
MRSMLTNILFVILILAVIMLVLHLLKALAKILIPILLLILVFYVLCRLGFLSLFEAGIPNLWHWCRNLYSYHFSSIIPRFGI